MNNWSISSPSSSNTWNISYCSSCGQFPCICPPILSGFCPQCKQQNCLCLTQPSWKKYLCTSCQMTPCQCGITINPYTWPQNATCQTCNSFPCQCGTFTTTATTGTWIGMPKPILSVRLFDGITNAALEYNSDSAYLREEGENSEKRTIQLIDFLLPSSYKVHIVSLGRGKAIITHPIPLKIQYTTKENEERTNYLVLSGLVEMVKDNFQLPNESFIEISDNFSIIKLLTITTKFRKENTVE